MAMVGVPTPARAATATDNQAAPPGSDRLNEPAVAVDPRDPQRVVTAANDLDTGPVGVYTSLDGANTFWRASLLPLLDGTHTEADPGLAFDRLGRAYASYVSYDRTSQSNFDFSRGGLAVARSDDGGLSWPSAVLAIPNHNDSSGCFFADFPSIDVARGASGQAADTVYVAWQSPGASGADCSQLSTNGSRIGVARSDDGGRTWHALPFPPPSAGISPYLPVVYAGADGSVHVAYDETHDADDPTACFGQGHVHVMVASSTDGGQTWITSEAHSGSCYGVETDPQPPVGVGLASLNGALYRLPASTNVVKDPRTGVLVSVAGDGDSTGGWVVDVASSMDSRHWTRGAVPARTPGEMQEFPRLAVAPDGTLSLLAAPDTRRDRPVCGAEVGSPGPWAHRGGDDDVLRRPAPAPRRRRLRFVETREGAGQHPEVVSQRPAEGPGHGREPRECPRGRVRLLQGTGDGSMAVFPSGADTVGTNLDLPGEGEVEE